MKSSHRLKGKRKSWRNHDHFFSFSSSVLFVKHTHTTLSGGGGGVDLWPHIWSSPCDLVREKTQKCNPNLWLSSPAAPPLPPPQGWFDRLLLNIAMWSLSSPLFSFVSAGCSLSKQKHNEPSSFWTRRNMASFTHRYTDRRAFLFAPFPLLSALLPFLLPLVFLLLIPEIWLLKAPYSAF